MRYFDGDEAPRYGFGSGLSYTEFAYEVLESGMEAVKVKITNTGSRGGYAVPQLYVHRVQGVVTSRCQLCGFKKLWLGAGEEQTLTIPIPKESLMQFDYAMQQRLVRGKVRWFLRDSGRTFADGDFMV